MQGQMYYLFILLLIHPISTAHGQAPPVITYICDNTPEVTDFSITGDHFDHIRLSKNNVFCEPKTFDKQGVIDCLNKLKATGEMNVTLIYEDLTRAGFTGGNNIRKYLITCLHSSQKITAKLNSINVVQSQKLPTELDIPILEHPQLTIKSQPPTIYVGDKVTLQLVINAKYKMLPTNCSAYKTDADQASYQFWSNCGDNNDKAIISEKLWTSVDDPQHTQTIFTIEMYAFRFTEQPEVIIKCDTWVCPSGKQECDQSVCPTPPPGRKRRDAKNTLKEETNVTTETASVALAVYERTEFPGNGSKALSPLWYIYAGGFGIIYWITVKKV